MIYIPEINWIAKCINDLLISNSRSVLFNFLIKINQLFWSNIFIIAIYLLNHIFLSFFKYDYPLAIWLEIYNSSIESYTLDLDYFQTFNY